MYYTFSKIIYTYDTVVLHFCYYFLVIILAVVKRLRQIHIGFLNLNADSTLKSQIISIWSSIFFWKRLAIYHFLDIDFNLHY